VPKGNGLPALAVALALAALACLGVACGGATRFSPRLPPDLIDVSRWEKLAGSAGIVSARLDVEYELYVSPQRPNVYSVTRYRITLDCIEARFLAGRPQNSRWICTKAFSETPLSSTGRKIATFVE